MKKMPLEPKAKWALLLIADYVRKCQLSALDRFTCFATVDSSPVYQGLAELKTERLSAVVHTAIRTKKRTYWIHQNIQENVLCIELYEGIFR
ncbi:unnamed protein product [Calicophoron daubneyi]|uniref:Uncharacterized protein n=1 Tax=Calicophoron daubneyi TaxID=300641 RepID=A0AAV2T3C0_CALDB